MIIIITDWNEQKSVKLIIKNEPTHSSIHYQSIHTGGESFNERTQCLQIKSILQNRSESMIINDDDGDDDGNVHDNLDRDWKNNYITISNTSIILYYSQ